MTEFRFEQCLGRGGFGEVYRGVMSRGGGVEVDVAIKVLRPDLDPESQGVQRLRDEGRLLGRLTHPAILRVYDLVVIEGRAALVSEYVPGDDLGRLLRSERLPPRAVFEIVAQVAAALDAAWSWPSVTDGKPLHLVHRDVKPDNIRVDPHGSVKLLDFGIAQAQTVHREAQTRVNTIMGSTHYLAPERLVQQEVGPESDVFALGCTLFEALAGEALFARKSMRQMYLLMVEERKFDEFVAERCGAFPGRLGGERAIALLRAMVSWRKQNRPTAAEVASRCDAISDSMEGQTLTQWCRARTWPPLQSARGPLEGYTFASAVAEPGMAAGLIGQHHVVKTGGPPRPVPWGESAPASAAPERAPLPLSAAPDRREGDETQRREAEPGENDRPKVLGETSGQTFTDMQTAMKRGIAAHSPHPWAPAEMVAVIDSPFPVLYRIPQLLRQMPEPVAREPLSHPVSATEALTVHAPRPSPEQAPSSEPEAGPPAEIAASSQAQPPSEPEVVDPTVPLDRVPVMVGQTLVPFLPAKELPALDTPAAEPSLAPAPSSPAPPAPGASGQVPDRPSPVDAMPSVLDRPRLGEDAGETTAALLDEDTEVGEEVSTRGPARPSAAPVAGDAVAASPVAEGAASGEVVAAVPEGAAGQAGLPEELPTVRISRKRGEGQGPEIVTSLSSTPEPAPAAPAPQPLRPVEDFASFDDEPPTVPAGTTEHIRASVAASTPPPAPPAPSVPPASRRTPKAAEARKRPRRRQDLQWVVAWGSSMAGLAVGLAGLLVVAVVVWFRAG